MDKYNEYYKNSIKNANDINCDEFISIIYNLNRKKIIKIKDNKISNFKNGNIIIKFFVDEFSIASESDKDFKLINHFLTNLLV